MSVGAAAASCGLFGLSARLTAGFLPAVFA
jgi:hypothetical protein